VDERLPYPPGTRTGDRPAAAAPCATCGELTGRGYPSCLGCAEVVDRLWLADWHALLAAEQVSTGTGSERDLATRVLSAEVGSFAWTCTDWALRLVRCEECGGELGAGDPVCLACAAADASRWEWTSSAPPDAVTSAERTLRLAVLALRAPHRRRGAVVSTLRLVLPFLLAGEDVPSWRLRGVRAGVLAGRYADLAALGGMVALTNLPLVPWRRVTADREPAGKSEVRG
jgi:hypothetical protein